MTLSAMQTRLSTLRHYEALIRDGWYPKEGEIPWQASLLVKGPYGEYSWVGCGVIVGENACLTAFHVIEDFTAANREVFAGVGDNHRSNGDKFKAHLENKWPEYDIALLKFEDSLIINSDVQAVDIMDEKTLADLLSSSDRRTWGIVSGWGLIESSGPCVEYSPNLRAAAMYLDQYATDDDLYDHADLIRTKFFKCKSTGNAGPCTGDSGGPLVIRGEEGNPLLVGITQGFAQPNQVCHQNSRPIRFGNVTEIKSELNL